MRSPPLVRRKLALTTALLLLATFAMFAIATPVQAVDECESQTASSDDDEDCVCPTTADDDEDCCDQDECPPTSSSSTTTTGTDICDQDECPTSSSTTTTDTEIPIFPSTAALVLGSLGAIGGSVFMLRRSVK